MLVNKTRMKLMILWAYASRGILPGLGLVIHHPAKSPGASLSRITKCSRSTYLNGDLVIRLMRALYDDKGIRRASGTLTT